MARKIIREEVLSYPEDKDKIKKALEDYCNCRGEDINLKVDMPSREHYTVTVEYLEHDN